MNQDASWTAQDRGPYRLLVVEDEPLMRSIIVQLARSEGYEVMEAPAAEIALHIFEKEKIDLAILDLNLTSGGSGLDLLRKMRELDPEVMGIIVTAYASVESAVEALHQGAYDYITKPFANDHLKKVMRNALEGKALFRENRFLRQELREKYRFESIIGKSDAIESTFRVMEKVARTDSSVLITGESGTGKELVARAIHFSSERANNRFLPINCGALPESEAYPLGANDPVAFDVRVLCATNRNLEAEVKAGRFREELLYRINVINLNLPGLRERQDDIPLLANHFLRKYEKSLARTGMRFSKGAMRLLINYAWPGNVRELENSIERAAILAETDVIHSHDLPDKLRTSSPVMASIENPGLTLEELEREHIKRVLDKVENDKVKAAQVLGIHLSTLYRKVQRYRLDIDVPMQQEPARSA